MDWLLGQPISKQIYLVNRCPLGMIERSDLFPSYSVIKKNTAIEAGYCETL